MHLVEQYALSCGVKIDTPFVETSYFPLPFEKYVVVHPSSGMGAKNYDYYKDVIELCLPSFAENNIKIVQIGGPKDDPLPFCYHTQGSTTLNQVFYLIKNSLLLFGNDSFSAHVAGGFNKKSVSLYSNLFHECCKPYWGNPKDQVFIQADRKGLKPSFSAEESTKTVNNIYPEEVARNILKLLNLKNNLKAYSTLHIGSTYSQPILEVIPDFAPVGGLVPADTGINVRLDYLHNPEIAAQWCFNYKTHLVIKEPIEIKFLEAVKQNIVKITVELNDSFSENYIRKLRNLGIAVELFAPDNNQLMETRVEFIDWDVEKLDFPEKKDLDFIDDICDNTYYKSSKTLLSHGKQYSSKAAWEARESKSKYEPIIDSESFWKESQYFRIYNQE
tara:strand:- start:250 stop:1413 length:1164 start_codon:yes stop_codon:yes gene_type:complete